MRLGQLARKFDITPQEIIAFTKSKGIEINTHPNSKLEDDVEALVMEHFDVLPEIVVDQVEPEFEIEPQVEIVENEAIDSKENVAFESAKDLDTSEAVVELEVIETTTLSEEPIVEETLEITETSESPSRKAATVAEILEDESEMLISSVDVIKAPKVELQGLKVVGKIELPSPKVKEPEQENPSDGDTNEVSPANNSKVPKKNHKVRKRLTEEEMETRRLKAKKQREEKAKWELHKQKLREERKKKEQKEKFYKNKLKDEVVAAAKPKKKKKAVKQTIERDNRPKPKTALGKFWRWLNT